MYAVPYVRALNYLEIYLTPDPSRFLFLPSRKCTVAHLVPVEGESSGHYAEYVLDNYSISHE